MTTYLLSKDTLSMIGRGAIGAMSFGVFQQYNFDKIMNLNNQINNGNREIDLKNHATDIANLENKHKIDITTLEMKLTCERKHDIDILTKQMEELRRSNQSWFSWMFGR